MSGNACKYSDKGQPVSVNVSADTENVVIVVEDNGVGVDNNEIEK
ncbi:ATP-binding region, ATPase-like domain protein, partial [marine sediment metagenome]